MNVLITGGAGFIGSHLADHFLARGHRVRILDNLTEQVHRGQRPAWLNPEAEFIRADVRDRDALARALDATQAVVHLAAAVGVAQSQYQIHHYFDVNVGGTAALADILANERHDVGKVLLAGSMTSYGEGCTVCAKCGPVRSDIRLPQDVADGVWEPRCPICRRVARSIPTPERAQLRAENIYAITKHTQERLVQHLSRLTGIHHVIFRLFNVIGTRQSLSNPYTGVAAIFISRLKGGAAPIIFEDGLQSRDFIPVADVARAFCDALESDRANDAVLNLGSGQPLTVLDLSRKITRLMNADASPQVTLKFRHGDVRHCTAETACAAELLNFSPQTSFDDALAELIDWSLSQHADDRFDASFGELKHHRMLS